MADSWVVTVSSIILLACITILVAKLQYFHPIFLYVEYLTQNVIFHVKSHVTKHEFWGLLILKWQHLMLPNLIWNETRNDTSLNKLGVYLCKNLHVDSITWNSYNVNSMKY